MTDHAAQFFTNDSTPRGIFKMGEATGPQARDHSRDLWETFRAGMRGSHRLAFVDYDVTFVPVGFPPDQAQFLQQRQLTSTEICRVFRVPPWIIGAQGGDTMTYSNTESQDLHFVKYSLTPWLKLIEQSISNDPDLCPGSLYCEFLLDALLRADSLTRAQVYEKALTGKWMTVEGDKTAGEFGMTHRPIAGAVEERAVPDVLDADGKRIRGRIPYNVQSRDMGRWREVIEPGALNGTKFDDLVVTVDHAGVPLGRYPGTLELEDRSDGLHWSVDPPASRADIREAIERGDLRAGSWRMVVAEVRVR